MKSSTAGVLAPQSKVPIAYGQETQAPIWI